MFLVSNEAATAIRKAWITRGELAAVAVLRSFYKIDDDTAALNCARTIASWASVAPSPHRALDHDEPDDTATGNVIQFPLKKLRRRSTTRSV